MLGVSRIYCSSPENSDDLRYKIRSDHANRKPVVVFNTTRRCNLKCQHCYASSDGNLANSELTHEQALALIDDAANMGSPAMLFSGGEPMLRNRITELVARAKIKGMRSVLSTNGTLITTDAAKALKKAGADYIGISLDSVIPENNDTFRGMCGGYDMAMAGIENCQQADLKVGLRLTITGNNIDEIPAIFELMNRKKITRVCFYHLVSVGRGENISKSSRPSNSEIRKAVDYIFDYTKIAHDMGNKIEVLTVDNNADAAYLYMRIARENPELAERTWDMLTHNGGNSSGQAIGCVSWDGSVYPDQFWRTAKLGSIQDKPFSQIWRDKNNELLNMLRNRKELLCERCRNCRFLNICNGNLRARSHAAGNGMWGFDPGCYLTDDEIAPQ